MDLDKATKAGNRAAADACAKFMTDLGTGKEYRCAAISMASTLMFHVYRIGKNEGKSVEFLQAALDDVAHNILELDGVRIKILVERR